MQYRKLSAKMIVCISELLSFHHLLYIHLILICVQFLQIPREHFQLRF